MRDKIDAETNDANGRDKVKPIHCVIIPVSTKITKECNYESTKLRMFKVCIGQVHECWRNEHTIITWGNVFRYLGKRSLRPG